MGERRTRERFPDILTVTDNEGKKSSLVEQLVAGEGRKRRRT